MNYSSRFTSEGDLNDVALFNSPFPRMRNAARAKESRDSVKKLA